MSTGGVRTLSITWIMPFEACTSGVITVASLMETVPSTVNLVLSPLTISANMPSVTALAGTAPATTW